MRKLALLLLVAALAGCSSEPTKTAEGPKPAAAQKPAVKPPEFQTGRTAFYEMYRAARQWAPDVKAFRLQSSPTKEAPGTDGKAEVWLGWFASAAKREVKPYTWSGGTGENLPERGVSFGPVDSFNPSNASTQPFDAGFLKSDSDEAYKAAQAKGGEALLKKNPGLPIIYTLDWDAKSNELIWHVSYGETPQDYKLKIAVNASTGGFLKKEK
ncbi:MAG TPA: hypothetical protein VMS96_15620 [Terriglobales bacterium]|nr:hypothetical protein [Terriglobales bacterium]